MTLSNSENLTDLLQKLYERTTEAMFFFAANGQILSMNEAAKEIVEPEIYEKMLEGETNSICLTCRGFTSEDEQMTCVSCFMSKPQETLTSFQLFLETKDLGLQPFSATYQVIDEAQGTSVLMLRNLTRQTQTAEVLNQKMRMQQVIQAQENERKRISRELHDSVAQEMLSSLVDLRVLKYMDVNDKALEKLRQTEGSLMRLLDEIRHLSVELRPAVLDDFGLEAAFRTHIKGLEKNYGLIVHLSSDLEQKRYEGEIETVIYRIGQEAMLNAMKYAEVEEVFLTLKDEQGILQLEIEDEGVGFDVNDFAPQGTGLGLFGMKERVELVGGNITIVSRADEGTKIQVEIPAGKGRAASENHNS
ncbi:MULTISPECIES: sensor histidine kinase [unclassified Sporosarcina]|uniref:sensor histidine kinase n=1 Tax=unclassified Sporosarcina TaxID=2647733 RepID=UPI002041F670|nr:MULTISPECIES: sensor histidine kinase [unclassified Sporosarcina]GKV65166.1 sensor histidine kinase [Sporosarcina sp. NCCP-2331]GLB55290.1 sensor histidine kinase [Sporosarcina sp. NCCP-2378]